MIFDEAALAIIVAEASAKALSKRQRNAIHKAHEQLLKNQSIGFANNSLYVASPSGRIYEVNDRCQCTAVQQRQPCWHRAAYELVRAYNEKSLAAKLLVKCRQQRPITRAKAQEEVDELFS